MTVRFSTGGGLDPDRVTVTINDDDIGNRVSFGADTYTTTEGESPVQVTLTLSRAPSATVDIPLFVLAYGGATDSDHSGIPRNVRFSTTDTSRTFAVTATDDADNDDGESITIVFGTLPTGFNAGSPASATVNLDDDEELSIQGDVRGKLVVGQTLTADTSGITDGNGLGEFSYRWLRDGTDTVHRGSTYTLGESEAGRRISVRVTFTDGIGNSETRVSPRTSRVAMPTRKLVGTASGGHIITNIGEIPESRRAWSQGFFTGANEQGYAVDHFAVSVNVAGEALGSDVQVIKLFEASSSYFPVLSKEVATLSSLGAFPGGVTGWTGNSYASGVKLEKTSRYVFAATENSATSRFICNGNTNSTLASDGLADWGMGAKN